MVTTLDELAQHFEMSSAPDVQRIAQLLRDWKSSDETVEQLDYLVSKFLGNVRLPDVVHANVYASWSSFARDKIWTIQGMTMNERLYIFGLHERFDAAGPSEQAMIYSKVLATA